MPRKPIGETAVTDAERQPRYRAACASGKPAIGAPRQQAGHMTAIDLPVALILLLHPSGRPHMRGKRIADHALRQ